MFYCGNAYVSNVSFQIGGKNYIEDLDPTIEPKARWFFVTLPFPAKVRGIEELFSPAALSERFLRDRSWARGGRKELNLLQIPPKLFGMATKANRREVREIPLSQIEPDPEQPRKQLGELKDLMASVKRRGVIQPIIVNQVGNNRFRIISGHRRYAASEKVGRKTIPALIQSIADAQDRAAIQLIENLHREDLNPFDEADAMHELITRHGMKQKQLAEELGMSPAAVNQRLRLRSVGEALRREIQTSETTPNHSLLLEIAKIAEPSEQVRMWRELNKNGKPTVREARRRGSYGKRYDDFMDEEDGLKVMIRWKIGTNYADKEAALKKALQRIEKALQEI